MTTVEFGSKAVADAVREEYADHLCSDDDRRLKTVTFASDTPDVVLEQARIEAADSRGDHVDTVTADLSQAERDRISDLGGFDRTTTTKNWERARGVFQREGLIDQWNDALPALVDYDDPIEGAEEWIERAQRSDAERGTQSASGGVRDVGDEDVRQERRAADAAAMAATGRCDHARGHCEHGDPEACEFLQGHCGFDEEDVEQLLLADADAESDDLPGQARGALKRAWQGYKGASTALAGALDDAREQWRNAQQAARAINGIREAHGQDRLEFDNLVDGHQALSELAREAAADCHECHGLDVVPADQQATDDDVAEALDEPTFVDDRPEQGDLTAHGVEPDVRQQQGREARLEAGQASSLLSDDRHDPDRGTATDQSDTEQETFRDPAQQSL